MKPIRSLFNFEERKKKKKINKLIRNLKNVKHGDIYYMENRFIEAKQKCKEYGYPECISEIDEIIGEKVKEGISRIKGYISKREIDPEGSTVREVQRIKESCSKLNFNNYNSELSLLENAVQDLEFAEKAKRSSDDIIECTPQLMNGERMCKVFTQIDYKHDNLFVSEAGELYLKKDDGMNYLGNVLHTVSNRDVEEKGDDLTDLLSENQELLECSDARLLQVLTVTPITPHLVTSIDIAYSHAKEISEGLVTLKWYKSEISNCKQKITKAKLPQSEKKEYLERLNYTLSMCA